jgi:hypothetical protein
MLLDRELNIGKSSYQSALSNSKGEKPKFEPLKHQSYQEHISDLVKAYDRSIRPSIQYVMRQLGDLTGITADSIDQAIR